MSNRDKCQASLEERADAHLHDASRLEEDKSGNWQTQSRRRAAAQRLRERASRDQRAASRRAGLDLPEDLPF